MTPENKRNTEVKRKRKRKKKEKRKEIRKYRRKGKRKKKRKPKEKIKKRFAVEEKIPRNIIESPIPRISIFDCPEFIIKKFDV